MERRKFEVDKKNLNEIENHVLAIDEVTLKQEEKKMLKGIPEKIWLDAVAKQGYNRAIYNMLKTGKCHILDIKKSREHGFALNWNENVELFYKVYDILYAHELANEFDNDIEPPDPYHMVMNNFRNEAYKFDITPNTYMERILVKLLAGYTTTIKSNNHKKTNDDFNL